MRIARLLITLLFAAVAAHAQITVRPTVQPPANLFTLADATATRTSNNTVLYPFSAAGVLLYTFNSITGSPSGCTFQVQSGDVIGTFINNGAAVALTVVNGMTGTLFTPASNLIAAVQMRVVYACSVYPTAGNLTLDFAAVPGSAPLPTAALGHITTTGVASLSSGSSTAVVFIPAGTGFNDLTSLVITNTQNVATIVTLSDNGAGGNTHSYAIAASGGIVMNFNPPLPQGTSSVAWDVKTSAGLVLDYEAVFVKN